MDQVSPQPMPTPTPPVSPVIPAPKTTVSHIFFTILFLVVFSIAGYFGYQNLPAVKVDRLIKDCLSRGGALGESYPPQCFTPTPTPTQFADPTANWQTYTNTTIAASIKYPTEWVYKEGQKSVTFETLTPSLEKKDGKTINFTFDFIIEDPSNFASWSTLSDVKNLGPKTINGLPFERYIVPDMYYSLNYIYKSTDGKTIRFMLFPYTPDETKTILDDTINQIISTFTFVDKPSK